MNEKYRIFENVIVGSGPSATSLLVSGNFKNNTCVIDANEKYTKKDFSINEKDLYKNHDIKSKIDQNDIGNDLSKKIMCSFFLSKRSYYLLNFLNHKVQNMKF